MKKLSFLAIALLVTLVSCSDEKEPIIDDPEQPGVTDPEPVDPVTDLSADEMANCYIVQKEGKYKFKADNQFNLGDGLPVPPQIHPVSAVLVWQSVKSSINSVELVDADTDPYVVVDVAKAEGNALVAVLDKDGKIEWSWHIWMPAVEIDAIPTSTGYEIMNMNLGAMNNTPGDVLSYGLLYQWGRKDPFTASPTLTGTLSTVGAPVYDIDNNEVEFANSSWTSMADNTIAYSISHPTVVLSNYSQYATSRDWLKAELSDDALWGNPDGDYREQGTFNYPNSGSKTCYDPSPAGWRVAPADAFSDFTDTHAYAWEFDQFNVADSNNDGLIDINDFNYGWHFNVNDKTALYFPAATRYDGSYAMLMGTMSGLWGNYWSNAPYKSINGGAFCALSFQVKSQTGAEMITISPSGGSSRADAFSIRCIRAQ